MEKINAAENAKNQSSLDRILKLPKTLAERQGYFDTGLAEIKRQKLLSDEIKVVGNMDEILLGTTTPYGGWKYKPPVKDPEKAFAVLKANSKWFAADGIYNGNGVLTIYATATSSDTKLIVYRNTMLDMRLRSLPFRLILTSVENVIQTIAHEIGHHKGLSHSDAGIYDGEYMAVRRYRSRK